MELFLFSASFKFDFERENRENITSKILNAMAGNVLKGFRLFLVLKQLSRRYYIQIHCQKGIDG